MRGSRRVLALAVALSMAVACEDLDVENLNAPDRERALASPGDVESLISGSFLTWWYTQGSNRSMGLPTSVMADQHSSSWGGSSMKESSQEPRTWAFVNDPAYGYYSVIEYTWSRCYRALVAVRDGLLSVAGPDGELGTIDDMQIGLRGQDTHRAIAFGKFVQGLATMTLALSFDQAWVVTESTDLEAELTRVPYMALRDSALHFFEQAITLANRESFTIPSSWMGSATVDSDRLIRLANSFAARTLAYTPRTVAERDAVDWGEVLSRVNAGITEDFILTADDETWWNYYMVYSEHPGWARTDLRTVGPADQGGGWEAWEKETPGLRLPFEIDADDLRLPVYPPVEVLSGDEHSCWGQPRSTSCGGDGLKMKMEYRDPMRPFRPERGTYHFSGYAAFTNYEYFEDWLGPMRYMMVFEMDMLRAEAYIRPGPQQNVAAALPLINATRVTYGGLAPVMGIGKVPWDDAPANSRCTPRIIDPFPMGQDVGVWQCGDLMEAMKWEKRLESYSTAVGLAWFDDRGWGDLIEGTITMYPVPADELMMLLEGIYTFGGDCTQVGSAPCNPDIVPWEDDVLRPLKRGEVPSEADLRARVELFERWNAADAAAEQAEPLRR